MDFDDLIDNVGHYLNNEDVKEEMVSLLYSVRSFLDEDEICSINNIIYKRSFTDSAKLSAVRATCNQYL